MDPLAQQMPPRMCVTDHQRTFGGYRYDALARL